MKRQLTRMFIALALYALSIAHAQNAVFTYQGQVLDNGTNFNGTGQFEFALVTSNNANHTATATANINMAGPVTGIAINNIGNGYLIAPAVTISGGGGSGATAHATLSGSSVMVITVDNGGSGYFMPPTVTIAPPPANISYTTYWSNDGSSMNGSEPLFPVSVAVSNGLFTVALGDTSLASMSAISAALFNQPGLQLQIWFNDGTQGFAALNPVQNLTPAPYAVFANTASNVSGIVSAAQISGAVASANLTGTYGNSVALTNANDSFNGSYAGDGGNMTNVNATKLGGFGAANFWQLGGNSVASGEVLGSTNDESVEFYAYGCRVLSLVPDSSGAGAPNVIGGSPANYVAAGIRGATIGGGGTTNVPFAGYTLVLPNSVTDNYGTVSGGLDNNAGGFAAAVGGGSGNTASGDYSFAAGQQAQAVHAGAFVWADSQGQNFGSTANDQFNVRAGGGVRLVTSGAGMTLDGPLTGTGGLNLDNTGTYGVNPGTVVSNALVFGTGPLGSGEGIASKRVGVNPYDLEFFTGFKNRMTINSSGNVGIVSTSPEGLLEIQGGADGSGANDQHDIALAYRNGGYRHWIRTRHDAIVSGNPTDNAIDFFVNNSTSAAGSSAPGTGSALVMSLNGGNVGIANAEPTHLLVVDGSGSPAYCDGTGWYPSSDRNIKSGFEAVSARAVLDKVAALPITRWHYTNDLTSAHVGPMAQDFYAAFNIGPDDKHIGPIDEGGVALAAIQGLNQKLEETRAESKVKDAEIRKFKEQNDSLAQRLADLEATVKALADRK